MPKPTFHNLPPEKRDRIVQSAIDEFSSTPYGQATLDRIVDAAGISKGSMYQYFGGKAELYRWLLTEHLPARKVAAIGASAPPTEAGIWEVLEQAFLAAVRFFAAEPKLARLGLRFHRDHEVEPSLAAIRQQHRDAADQWLRGLLTDGIARGLLRPDLDLPVTASLLAHALGEGLLELLARHAGTDLDGLFADPETLRLPDEELLALVRRVTRLFRVGAEAR